MHKKVYISYIFNPPNDKEIARNLCLLQKYWKIHELANLFLVEKYKEVN